MIGRLIDVGCHIGKIKHAEGYSGKCVNIKTSDDVMVDHIGEEIIDHDGENIIMHTVSNVVSGKII